MEIDGKHRLRLFVSNFTSGDEYSTCVWLVDTRQPIRASRALTGSKAISHHKTAQSPRLRSCTKVPQLEHALLYR